MTTDKTIEQACGALREYASRVLMEPARGAVARLADDLARILPAASEAEDAVPTQGDVKAWHRYLREALQLPDDAPYRFDYYAQVIEQRAASDAGAVPWFECSEATPMSDVRVLVAGTMDGPHDWRVKTGFYSSETRTWHVDLASWQPIKWAHLPRPDAAPLAQQEAGAMPVAWRYWNEKSKSWNTTTSQAVADAMREGGRAVESLYTAPPAQPEFRHNAAGPEDQAIYDSMAANYRQSDAQGDERAVLDDLSKWARTKACATDEAIAVSWSEIYPFVARARAALSRQPPAPASAREQTMEAAIKRALQSLAGDYQSMAADLRAALFAAKPGDVE